MGLIFRPMGDTGNAGLGSRLFQLLFNSVSTGQGGKRCQQCRKNPATGSVKGTYGWMRVCKKCKKAMGVKPPKNIIKHPPKKDKDKDEDDS